MRMLTKQGIWINIDWSYDPKVNTKWTEKAYNSLRKQGVKGEVYEVAPECFWYKTKEKDVNCGLY